MNATATIALALSLVAAISSRTVQEIFVFPRSPVSEGRAAPSPKVVNGTVFESGSLDLPANHKLVVPSDALVERYDGAVVRFQVTKTQRCNGQPPVPMSFVDSRRHFGIAQQAADGAVVVCTFGEWANRGGSARIRLLILVPRGVKVEEGAGLSGADSDASTKFNPGDDALKKCYWYAGPRPAGGWSVIETDLHYNKFLRAG